MLQRVDLFAKIESIARASNLQHFPRRYIVCAIFFNSRDHFQLGEIAKADHHFIIVQKVIFRCGLNNTINDALDDGGYSFNFAID